MPFPYMQFLQIQDSASTDVTNLGAHSNYSITLVIQRSPVDILKLLFGDLKIFAEGSQTIPYVTEKNEVKLTRANALIYLDISLNKMEETSPNIQNMFLSSNDTVFSQQF